VAGNEEKGGCQNVMYRRGKRGENPRKKKPDQVDERNRKTGGLLGPSEKSKENINVLGPEGVDQLVKRVKITSE